MINYIYYVDINLDFTDKAHNFNVAKVDVLLHT